MIYFAHRGLSDYAPENTMAAFDMAVKAGAKAIELDVQRTADGQIVVMHDFYLGRTNNGQGLIKDHDYESLRKLDAGSWFAPDYAGQRIPLLTEVMQHVPKEVLINIEMKKPAIDKNKDFARNVVEIIHQYPRPVLVSSFDHGLLKEVQELDSRIPLGLLYCSSLIDVFAYARSNGLNIEAIHPSMEYVDAALVQKAHALGVKVHVYTIRHKEEAELLRSWQVDGIFVNNFDIL